MRKLILTLLAIGGLVLGASTPALAAPPSHQHSSGSYTVFHSETSGCNDGSGTCVSLFYNESPGETFVCLSVFDPATGTGRGGCVEGVTLSIESGTVSLASTVIVLEDEAGNTTEVTVSARDTTSGQAVQETGKGTRKVGSCTERYSFKELRTPVTGTITIGGTTYDESGELITGFSRFASRCRA